MKHKHGCFLSHLWYNQSFVMTFTNVLFPPVAVFENAGSIPHNVRVTSLLAGSHDGRSEQTCIKRSSLIGCCSRAVLRLSCTSYTVPAAPTPIIVLAACGSD